MKVEEEHGVLVCSRCEVDISKLSKEERDMLVLYWNSDGEQADCPTYCEPAEVE